MSELSLNLPTIGKPDKTEDVKLNTALTAIQTWANGNVDSTNFPKAVSTTTAAGPYTTLGAGTSAKEEEPSSTRPAFVLWQAFTAGSAHAGMPFLVPAGSKWKITVSTVEAKPVVGGVSLPVEKFSEAITSFTFQYLLL